MHVILLSLFLQVQFYLLRIMRHPRGRDLSVFRFLLNPDIIEPFDFRRTACRAAPAEWIQYNTLRRCHEPHRIPRQVESLNGGMVVIPEFNAQFKAAMRQSLMPPEVPYVYSIQTFFLKKIALLLQGNSVAIIISTSPAPLRQPSATESSIPLAIPPWQLLWCKC